MGGRLPLGLAVHFSHGTMAPGPESFHWIFHGKNHGNYSDGHGYQL